MNVIVRKILKSGLRLMRWAVRKVKESETRPYQIELSELILRARKRWKNATAMRYPECPYCEAPMLFRHSKIVITVGPVRDDQGWKCLSCFHTAHFGIPMTREDALTEIDLRGSPTLMRPSERPDEDGLDVVTERLRRLGYIE
jgi:hypothetical protein